MDKLEAVARAICISEEFNPDETFMGLPVWNEWVPNARAALSAIPDERAAGIREGLEMAAKACEAQQQIFGSTQYATGQPWSSFGERFACGKCAEEIRALKDSPPPPTV